MSRGLGKRQRLILAALHSLEKEADEFGGHYYVWAIINRAYELSEELQAQEKAAVEYQERERQWWEEQARAGDRSAREFLMLDRRLFHELKPKPRRFGGSTGRAPLFAPQQPQPRLRTLELSPLEVDPSALVRKRSVLDSIRAQLVQGHRDGQSLLRLQENRRAIERNPLFVCTPRLQGVGCKLFKGSALPVRLGQQVMGGRERHQATLEGGRRHTCSVLAVESLVGDPLHHGEGVLDPVVQLGEE
jgi:hypothetical protein